MSRKNFKEESTLPQQELSSFVVNDVSMFIMCIKHIVIFFHISTYQLASFSHGHGPFAHSKTFSQPDWSGVRGPNSSL